MEIGPLQLIQKIQKLIFVKDLCYIIPKFRKNQTALVALAMDFKTDMMIRLWSKCNYLSYICNNIVPTFFILLLIGLFLPAKL